MDVEKPSNGWFEWSRWVLKNIEIINERLENIPKQNEIEKLTIGMETLREDIHELEKKLAQLEIEMKVRAGIFGAIGAAIPVIALILMKYLGGP